jgi:hypothetical protein
MIATPALSRTLIAPDTFRASSRVSVGAHAAGNTIVAATACFHFNRASFGGRIASGHPAGRRPGRWRQHVNRLALERPGKVAGVRGWTLRTVEAGVSSGCGGALLSSMNDGLFMLSPAGC